MRVIAGWLMSRSGFIALGAALLVAAGLAVVGLVMAQPSILILAVCAGAAVLVATMMVLAATLLSVRAQLGALTRAGGGWTDATVQRVMQHLGDGPTGIEERVRRGVARDVSALLGLHQLVAVGAEVPPPSGWAATPQTLLAMVDAVRGLPDGAVIVECGSGTSSVWLGLAAAQQDRGITVVALEHEVAYAEQTRHALRANGLEATVEVRVAPLSPTVIDDQPYSWFAPEALDGLTGIALLFVDGPPGSTGEQARFPAFPLLRDRLSDGCLVILDDTNRRDERETLSRWMALDGRGRLRSGRELDRATSLIFELP